MRPSTISEEFRRHDVRVHAWLLLEWLQDPQRPPANVSFTGEPLRIIATAIEQIARQGCVNDEAAEADRRDAAYYRTLRNSLANPPVTTTSMPALVAPFTEGRVTYAPEGLDQAMKNVLAQLGGSQA